VERARPAASRCMSFIGLLPLLATTRSPGLCRLLLAFEAKIVRTTRMDPVAPSTQQHFHPVIQIQVALLGRCHRCRRAAHCQGSRGGGQKIDAGKGGMRRQNISNHQDRQTFRYPKAVTTQARACPRMRLPTIRYRFGHWTPFTYPSVKVCMKATRAFSSSSVRPSFPSWRAFMFAATSGAGQHEIFSPGSFGAQRGRTSRVL
jgi:hypothetical protein